MANRFDVTTTKNWKLDARGRLIVKATPTRSGIFLYRNDQGETVRELRHPDEVFSDQTMESLNGIPYTTQSNHIALMKPNNVREKTYGFTLQNAKRVDNHSQIDIKINDESEIKAVTNGESLELSNGYSCDVIPESGEFEGEKYDARQVNIIYDHVARVEKARGGESCRIRLDSDCAISGIEAERLDSGNNQSTGEPMAEPIKAVLIQRDIPKIESGENFRLDSFSFKVDESQNGTIDKFMDREEKLITEVSRLNTEMTKQSVKMDSLTTENKKLSDSAEGSISKSRMDQEIANRVNLFSLADSLGIKEYKTMPITDLNKKVIEASGMFDTPKMHSAEWVGFAIEHLQTDHASKVMKSRKNLENSDTFHFDNADDDLVGESELEMA